MSEEKLSDKYRNPELYRSRSLWDRFSEYREMALVGTVVFFAISLYYFQSSEFFWAVIHLSLAFFFSMIVAFAGGREDE